jgi:hypothetical protein
MHSANRTAFSRLVAGFLAVLVPAPTLLPVPVSPFSAAPLEQPAPIRA